MKSILRRSLDLAVKHCSKICLLGYIGGIVWLASLAHPSMNNSTYFSENALLPGMVETRFNTHHTVRALKQEVEGLEELSRKNMVIWLMNKMTAIGLDAYQQNFTAKLPNEISEEGKTVGTNVYSILRAPRIAGTEALVFSVSFKDGSSGPFYELVLLLSLAEHFRNNIYWSKDIVFLVTDQKELGMQTWLDEYHGITSSYVDSSAMLGRSGTIQAAINLELEDQNINRMEVMMEGLNGQLPNLDLVNMVIQLCEREGIDVSLKKSDVHYLNDGWDKYRSALSTMGMMMFTQACGRPSSNHGFFPKYGIEAVTLKGFKDGSRGSVGFGKLGRALEGMFRSLNNLQERFHQSFFFYLLSSTHRYISIGLYMPPLGCLMVGPILVSVACWVWSAKGDTTETSKNKEANKQERSGEEVEEKTKDKGDGENKSSPKKDEKDSETVEPTDDELAFTRIPRYFGKVCRVVLAGYFVGLLLYITPLLSRHFRPVPFGLEPPIFSLVLLAVTFALSLTLPFSLSLSSTFTTRDVMLLKSISLVIYLCTVGCLATINFSFGYFQAVFTVPSFVVVSSTQNKLRRIIQVALVFLASPLSVLFILTLIYSYLTSQNLASYEQLLTDTTTLFIKAVLASLRDSFLFGSWSYSVTTLLLVPNWLLFWCIAWT